MRLLMHAACPEMGCDARWCRALCCCCCCPGAKSGGARCAGAAWHVLTLVFAEYPIRRHREWLGAVQPNQASDAAISRGSASGGEAKSGGGLGACFGGAKRRLPFACINPAPAEPLTKCGLPCPCLHVAHAP